MLLQKVDDRIYVHEKIEWMYKHADISVPTNRLGLAKGMGLVCWYRKLVSVQDLLFLYYIFFSLLLAGCCFTSGYCSGKVEEYTRQCWT